MSYYLFFGVIFMRIGFFDSGIGGITVLHEALKILPYEDYIYYADTVNAPYGVKPKKVVEEYILKAVGFIAKQEVDAVVVACNTATSVAIEKLRSLYDIPILGMEPAVKPAVEKSYLTNKRVLVTATPLTIKEEKLKNLITRLDNEDIVDLLPLPMLVEFAESFKFDDEIAGNYLKQELSKFDLSKYGTIVLGCTHFPLYKNVFRNIIPEDIDIIDGSIGTVKNLKRILEEKSNFNPGSGRVAFYNSGMMDTDNEKYNLLLKRMDKIS